MTILERPELAVKLLLQIESHYGEYVKAKKIIHVKEITMCTSKAWYDRNTEGEESEDKFFASLPLQARVKIALGTGFGKVLNEDEEEVMIQLEDGVMIVGHVDNTERDGPEPIPDEVKVTWMYGDEISSQYWSQLASYCVGYNVNVGHLYVVKVTEKGGPAIHCYERVFTDQELIDWREIMATRAYAIASDECPEPVLNHFGWECQGCKYNKNRVPDGPCEPGPAMRVDYFG